MFRSLTSRIIQLTASINHIANKIDTFAIQTRTVENLTIKILNLLGKEQVPFLFVIDFDKKKPWICPLSELGGEGVLYNVNGKTNDPDFGLAEKELSFSLEAISEEHYRKGFEHVQQNLLHGNTFLLNLTYPSHIRTNFSLEEIYFRAKAPYKLLFKGMFVVFSPETFIKINGKTIRSFPMKGTIDAAVPNAEELLLNNEKELAEHHTIVDLIRNDLSSVAKKVKVKRFRYIERITTNRNELLQMSSEITGELPKDFRSKLGEILYSLLPAGSVTGAPKPKTVEVIRQAEQYERGYYTGVFGLFDGENLDSGVMIRFIEKEKGGLVYKSGGGITSKSKCEDEYRELIEKIYIPL